MRYTRLAGVVVFVAIAALLASACGGGGASTEAEPTKSFAQSSQISKPKPKVMLVNATTAGVFENYFAILDITAKNEGADGVIIIVGSITQGSETKRNEMPVFLTKDTAQTIRLVFPIKWRGGEWTPSVETEVP
ncbi:MAG: hypothetical protein A2Y59_03085 [Chloroflexi bacterium RBG_13_52_14]|nr:MAG: hypothetical protein A2Y59_03085 [Chloroflexi bacterium RBG_13_52_14]